MLKRNWYKYGFFMATWFVLWIVYCQLGGKQRIGQIVVSGLIGAFVSIISMDASRKDE
jgi:hypothetical protein